MKKGEYKWNHEAQRAFDNLKQALSSAPVLALTDFKKAFIIETDASRFGIGVVLMQLGHPLAFLNKDLGPKR